MQRSRRIDRNQGATTRAVFRVHIFGQQGSGKVAVLSAGLRTGIIAVQSAFLSGFAGAAQLYSSASGCRSAISWGTHASRTVYLVVRVVIQASLAG